MGQKQSSADEINKEIEQMAKTMQKSVTDTKQALFDTILSLGPEGLKKAYPSLSAEQKEIFEKALSEMKKATHMPEVTQDAKVLSPVHTPTKNAKLKTESLSGSDDEDEKLMADKNKDVKHQGGPDDKPQDWEGQVIKAKEPEKADCPDDQVIGHTRSGKHIYDEPEHDMHKDFSPDDHKDARDLHMQIATPIRSKMDSPVIDKDDKRSPEERDKDHVKMYHQARMHEDSARKHSDEASRKEDAAMEKHYGSLMKDMGYTGGAGGYGLAMSMDKSFKEVEEHAKEEGARDPKAVAAAVGFKKLGKEEMEHRAQAGKEKAEKSYENFVTKSKLEKKQGVPEGVDPAKHEDCVHDVKAEGHGKVSAIKICNASMSKGDDMDSKECMDQEKEKLEKKKMRKAKRIAKALKKIVRFAKALGLSKDDVKKTIEAAGGDLQVVKSEMKSKINKEEDQVPFKPQDECEISDPKPDESKGDLEIKAEATADEAEKKLPEAMGKSIQYNFKSSIAARTLGRNTHWDVDAYIEKSEQEKQEIIKKGGYFGEEKVEELKKSQDAKLDINDMLEKGYDKYSQDEINRLEGIKNHKPDTGAVRKSNYDLEIARSMGMTKEEYEKIFGSNE